jgi:endonuclease G
MNRREIIRQGEWDMALAAGREWQARLGEINAQIAKIQTQGPRGADTPARVGKFLGRELARTRSSSAAPGDPSFIGLERRFGPTLDYEYIPPPEAQAVNRSVARLVEIADGGTSISAFATGFMVSPRLLMTNWHVFEERDWAQGVSAQFGYEYRGVVLQPGAAFELQPDQFFHADRERDFALVAVQTRNRDDQALAPFGFTRLIPGEGKILVGHGVNMIGYPGGMPKTYVIKNNPLVTVNDLTVQYLTDSDEGASGSPAYNPMWELIALHHRSVPKMENGRVLLKNNAGYWVPGTPTDDVDWIANEGIRISVIVSRLRQLLSEQPHPLLAELLETAVDPVGSEIQARGETAMQNPPVPLDRAPIQMNFSAPVTIHITQAAVPQPAAVNGAAQTGVSVVPGEEAAIRFDPDYDNRPGYDPTFLEGFDIPHPKASAVRLGEMLKEGDAELVLKYHNYSLAMNAQRRLQMWSAVNVDYSEGARKWFDGRKSFGSDKWIADPRIPAKFQIMDPEAYQPSKSLQRGHMVRRDDGAWGKSRKTQEYGNSDTFHWTNCTPQHGGFNQSDHFPGDGTHYEGLWGALENKVVAVAQRADGKRLIVFSGPVLDPEDDTWTWGFGDVQIPMKFWKVVLAVEAGKLGAYGFVLDQTQAFRDLGFERLRFGKFEHKQEPLAKISKLAGVDFDPRVIAADVGPLRGA